MDWPIFADLDGDGTLDPFARTFDRFDDEVFKTGGGVSIFDVNGDGTPEILKLVYNSPFSGAETATLYYRDINGSYTPSPEFSDLQLRGRMEQGVPFDYDNDGDLDLFIPRYAIANYESGALVYEPGSLLLQNDQGTFHDVTGSVPVTSDTATNLAFFDDARQPESVIPVDINRDGWIDLYTAGHLLMNTGSGFIDANEAVQSSC